MSISPRSILSLSLFTACLLTFGCGEKPKPSGKLQGKITFGGQPVPKAKIQIQLSKTGEAFAAKIGSDGAYQFDRPVTAGEYVAAIIPDDEMPVAGAEKNPTKPAARTDIPDNYRTTGKSGLKLEVKAGTDNKFDADLKK